jgi:hypothetical protein
VEHEVRMGDKRTACRLLVRKPEERIDFVNVEWGGVDWISLAQDSYK